MQSDVINKLLINYRAHSVVAIALTMIRKENTTASNVFTLCRLEACATESAVPCQATIQHKQLTALD